MKKTTFTIAVSAVIILIGIYYGNRNPKCIWIHHPKELKSIKGKISYIDINRIGDGTVNFNYRDFLGIKSFPVYFFPTDAQDWILRINSNLSQTKEFNSPNEFSNFLVFEKKAG